MRISIEVLRVLVLLTGDIGSIFLSLAHNTEQDESVFLRDAAPGFGHFDSANGENCGDVHHQYRARIAAGATKSDTDTGLISGVKTWARLRLLINGDQTRFLIGEDNVITTLASAVTDISEGAHKRIGAAIGLAVISFGTGALMVLTKSTKQYVGLT